MRVKPPQRRLPLYGGFGSETTLVSESQQAAAAMTGAGVHLSVRTGGLHGLGQVRVLLLEVLLEHHGQVVRRLVVARGALPVLARHQDAVGYAVARGGNVDVKDIVVDEFAVLDGAAEGARDQGARVGQLNAMANAVAAADPAGVDQIDAGVTVGDALAEAS